MAEHQNPKAEYVSSPKRPGFSLKGGKGIKGPVVRAKNTTGTIKRLWSYIGRQRASLIVVFLLTAASAITALLGPRLIGLAIDKYIIPQDYNGLLWISLALLGVYATSAAFSAIQMYVMAGVSQRTVWELRSEMFSKLQSLPLRFFDSKTHGELMSRTTNDVDNVTNTLNQNLTQLISNALTLVGTIVMMLTLSVRLTLLSLVTIPLMILVTSQIAKRTRKFFGEQQKYLGELNGFVEETVSGQKVVQVFGRQEQSRQRFSEINMQLRQVGVKAQILSGMMPPLMNVLNNLGYALIAGFGGWLAIEKVITVGVIVAFLNYVKQFTRPLNELANQFNTIQAAIAGAERVFEIMDEIPEYGQDEDGKQVQDLRGQVILDQVNFGYVPEVPVLKDVSLVAQPGTKVALVGPTGAGKTTIVNLLTRFYDLTSGKITIDGLDIRQLDKESLRRQIAMVLQDAYLFSDTIRENIRYGKLDATDAQIEAAASMANADGFIRRLPQGYDTMLTAEGGNLSQGQRQLITIARAILADPAILILDEATSSVDTRTEMHIQEAMQVLMQGRTSFVIAHRLSTIREADQILVINGGVVEERGTHEELLAKQGFYAELYNRQFAHASA